MTTIFTKAESSSDNEMIQPSTGKRIATKIGSKTSSFVAVTFFLVLAYQRDSYMITFFVGSILNGISSKILKRILNQDRPSGYESDESVKVKPSDKGMPSSHAMSLGFIGIYTALGVCGILTGFSTKILLCCALITYIAISLVYRVQSQLHTTDQVLVGLFFGTLNGFCWHSLAQGSNSLFPSVNIMNLVTNNLLPESGIMPVQYLIIPAFVGAAVVGSFERRISAWIKQKNQ